jgi:hypothetical protein
MAGTHRKLDEKVGNEISYIVDVGQGFQYVASDSCCNLFDGAHFWINFDSTNQHFWRFKIGKTNVHVSRGETSLEVISAINLLMKSATYFEV